MPRDLENEISCLQLQSGYPTIINIEQPNRANPIVRRIIKRNLCSAIMQVQVPSCLNNRQETAVLGTDVSCNLGRQHIPN